MSRPLPWTDLVSALGEERFAEVRSALAQSGTEALDRDAFLLNGSVAALLRELVPPEGPAEAITAYGALLHALYLAWSRDWPTIVLDRERLRARLAEPRAISGTPAPGVCYVQLPERLVWAEPESGQPHEPLDGLFAIAGRERLHVLAILGFRPERGGFTTMEAESALPVPAPEPREGSQQPPFTSTLPAGERAGLFSVTDARELAALAALALESAAG
jgi:hypothetical protein